MLNTYNVVMCMQRSHHFFDKPTSDDGPRSGWEFH